MRLLDGLNVCAVRNGIVFYGRIQHDDPGLATIKAMREVSPGYAVIETKADQYLNENGEETVHILRAALHELSFVPKSANPGSWFFLTDPREGVRS